jgi:hypothetical protein
MDLITMSGVLVTGGVDTHKDTHIVVVVNEAGRVLGTECSQAMFEAMQLCTPGCPLTASS